MKLLMVGSDHIWSLEKIYYKYLAELGINIRLFPAQNYFYEYYNRSILHKLAYRAGISSVLDKVNKDLKELVAEFNPDAIWIFKGMEIFPETLQWIASKKIFLFNYNPDNPFIFSGKGSGNKNLKQSITLYDLHFTYNLDVKEKLDQLGCKTEFLPFGFDLNHRLYEECRSQSEIVKTCFLGNPDNIRARFLTELADKGINIDIYGNHWNKFLDHPSITVFPAVYGDDFWKTLYRYRVQINLMRPHNENSHNMRSFEVPGCGGIMLAPDTREHRVFFIDGQEVFLFSGTEDCAAFSKNLLQSSKTETDKIRAQARAHSLQAGYTYKDRAHTVVETLKKFIA